MESKVGVKEFRANLPSYLESCLPVTITRHGEIVGYYIPARPSHSQAELSALTEAAAKLEAMMSARRVTEDDIATEFSAQRRSKKG